MPKTRPPYAAEFRQQMIDLVRAGSQAIRNWVAQACRSSSVKLTMPGGVPAHGLPPAGTVDDASKNVPLFQWQDTSSPLDHADDTHLPPQDRFCADFVPFQHLHLASVTVAIYCRRWLVSVLRP